MPNTNELKRGMRVQIDGDPYTVADVRSQSPSARGASTLIKTRMRNIRTGQLVDKTFKSGEHIPEADFEIRPSQYLYDDGDGMHYFMDDESYAQFPLGHADIEYELGFLRPNDAVRALFFEGECIGIELPHTVTLLVERCDPGVKGDTVNNVTKAATLETGLELQIPLFVNQGEAIVVDTRESRYIKRA
ncbi:MAG: elongation factor P [Myxococcales bacterium]|nr:elongation factor P [Myxococcales bacterium]